MKNTITLVLFLFVSGCIYSQKENNFKTPYGSNPSVGKYANVNGIEMYYEEYGKGEPIFLIHGNGGTIKAMENQIEFLRTKYRVIAADSRGHGKSELATDSLTYNQMADDWSDLATHLKVDSMNIIGWSDGGIIGLLIAINKPSRVKKMVTMGVNLRPDSTAIYSWAVDWIKMQKKYIERKISQKSTSQNWPLLKQRMNLMQYQPNISWSDLGQIKAPVLLIFGDKDVIREEHGLEIYHHIPNAQLCVLPGETHFAPVTSPALFNQFADKFIFEPFRRPDSNWTD